MSNPVNGLGRGGYWGGGKPGHTCHEHMIMTQENGGIWVARLQVLESRAAPVTEEQQGEKVGGRDRRHGEVKVTGGPFYI